MKHNKIIASAMLLLMMAQPMAGAIQTSETTARTKSATNESQIVPFADIIVRKHRIYNGKQQYRRWNQTRNYWVDPYWIDMP